MSVVIKGMQMPKNCSECPVALSGKYCRINKTHTTFIQLPIRPDHCPLVELPEHHGRLIDENEIIVPSLSSWADQVIVADAIMDAPTIIEAE